MQFKKSISDFVNFLGKLIPNFPRCHGITSTNILKEVTDKEPTICDSTEDMMAAIRAVNESGMINTKTTIGVT